MPRIEKQFLEDELKEANEFTHLYGLPSARVAGQPGTDQSRQTFERGTSVPLFGTVPSGTDLGRAFSALVIVDADNAGGIPADLLSEVTQC